MRAVDTNLLVRLLTRDDPRQASLADEFIKPGAWVSVLALAESTWVLSAVYSVSATSLAAGLDLILHHKNLTVQDFDAVAAALALFRANPSLGFSDCLILELARKAGHLPLGTFDRNLSKIDGATKL